MSLFISPLRHLFFPSIADLLSKIEATACVWALQASNWSCPHSPPSQPRIDTMDPPQLGESSRSPQRQTSPRRENADSTRNGHVEDVEDRMGRLILGSWPGKLHAFRRRLTQCGGGRRNRFDVAELSDTTLMMQNMHLNMFTRPTTSSRCSILTDCTTPTSAHLPTISARTRMAM